MTDYTITTNFGAKDSLPSGNAGKVIKGSEFTTEFTNIQTAVNTKADTAGDTFTGVVNFSADVAVNTNTLFVDVSENKVGIGTSSPAQALDVNGNIRVQGTFPKVEFHDTDNNPKYTIIGADTSFRIYDETNSTDRMLITSLGNVGIGTSSPDSILDVVGADPILTIRDTSASGADSHATLRLAESDGSGNVNVRFDVALDEGDLTFDYSNGSTTSERMRIDSLGKLLLNTSTHTLTDSEMVVASEYSASGTTTGGITLSSRQSGSWRNSGIFANGANLTFTTGDTGLNGAQASSERMRINSSGNVLVGKTSESNATAGVELNASGQIVATFANGTHVLGRNGSDGNILAFIKDGSTVGTISVTSSATSYNTSSDERLKENIADSADAGSKVDAIQIRQFDWKADGSHQDYGVIAQELINVAPEAVSEGDNEEDMMGVDYSKLVPMLIKEVQSLRSRVAELENV